MAHQKKAYLALTVTSLVWGTTWVASKMGVSHMPAFELASIRQLLGGSIYVSFFLLRGEGLPTKKQFLWLIPMAFLMFVSSNGIATYG
jgi:drug/metabolite transporter (DMT)-like permease